MFDSRFSVFPRPKPRKNGIIKFKSFSCSEDFELWQKESENITITEAKAVYVTDTKIGILVFYREKE